MRIREAVWGRIKKFFGVIDEHLIPKASGTYDVGKTDYKFREGYFSSVLYCAGLNSTDVIKMNDNEIQNVNAKLRNANSGTITPNAVAGTYGTIAGINPISGYSGFIPYAVKLVCDSIGTETLTIYVDATDSTGTYISGSAFEKDFTTTGSYVLTAEEMFRFFKDNDHINQFRFKCKSSINNSTATAHGQVVARCV